MTLKGVSNSVLKFGEILFTPIYCGVLGCRTLEGQGFFVEPEWNPSNNPDLYVNT